jgi:hypothetical protein
MTASTLHRRVLHHRAIEAAIWAMPLMNFKFYRDALVKAGVGPNDVGYFSKLQDWRFQTATPNNTTPYILNYWTIEDGPIVVELPASTDGVGVFGTIMDAWQRPLDDVGAQGRDRGLGAKYLLVPPNYNGKLLPNALVYEQETYYGFSVLRPVLPGGATEANLAKATALTQQIKIYPLAQADNPPQSQYVDLYGTLLEMTPKLDGSIYKEIHGMIQEEVVLDRDLTMMGLLARIGIKKGDPFEPDSDLQAIFDQAGPEALEYMIEQYHQELNPWMYEGKLWSSLVPEPGSRETEWTYEFPAYYDSFIDGHYDFLLDGATLLDSRVYMHFYATGITPAMARKMVGKGSKYAIAYLDAEGNPLDGSKTYKINLPKNVPAKNFWSFTIYDNQTRSMLQTDQRLPGLDNNQKGLKQNADGSYDVYFSPEAPAGWENNWIQTVPGKSWNTILRLYGPLESFYDKTWKPGDPELVG